MLGPGQFPSTNQGTEEPLIYSAPQKEEEDAHNQPLKDISFVRYNPEITQIVSTSQCKRKLIFGGHRYHYYQVLSTRNVIAWRCAHSKTRDSSGEWCKGRADTGIDNYNDAVISVENNHPPEHDAIEIELIKSQLLTAAREYPDIDAEVLVNEACNYLSDDVQFDKEKFKKCLNMARLRCGHPRKRNKRVAVANGFDEDRDDSSSCKRKGGQRNEKGDEDKENYEENGNMTTTRSGYQQLEEIIRSESPATSICVLYSQIASGNVDNLDWISALIEYSTLMRKD